MVYKRNDLWERALAGNNMNKVPDTIHQNGFRIQMAGQDFQKPSTHALRNKDN